MNKNSLRLYKTFIFILALILFLPIPKLSAHDVTKSPWLFINEIPITEEMENPIPNTSKLDWGEHVFSKELQKGDEVKVSIDREVIVSDLDVAEGNIQTSYKLKQPNGTANEQSSDFAQKLNDSGNYFLDVKLSRKDNGEEILVESVMIVVGSSPDPSKFKINGNEIDFSKAAPTYDVTDNLNLKFTVTNPESNNSYIWDLGTGETKEGIEINYSFEKAKIPVYVILRTTDKGSNVFSDSFVRLDSPKENNFQIPRPPVKIPDSDLTTSNDNITKYIIGTVVVILIAGLGFIIYKKKK